MLIKVINIQKNEIKVENLIRLNQKTKQQKAMLAAM